MDLENLTELDLASSLVTNTTISQLWKLTNLEKLDISGLDRGLLDWIILKKLPKLRALICPRYERESIAYEEYHYEVINSLTQLTLLELQDGLNEDPFPLEKISNLTNLRELHMLLNLPYDDFTKFQHLTFLNLTMTSEVERIRLPKGLKRLSAAVSSSHSDDIFKEIGDVDSLTELSIYYRYSEKLHHISRLTNLQRLTFQENLSPGT